MTYQLWKKTMYVLAILTTFSTTAIAMNENHELNKNLETLQKQHERTESEMHKLQTSHEVLSTDYARLVEKQIPILKEQNRKLKLDLEKKKEQPVQKEKETLVTNVIHGSASAYTKSCKGCTGITASGIPVSVGMVAMDRWVPFGTKVRISAPGYPSKVYTVTDRGGAIKGNRVDIFMNSEREAVSFGRRNVTIEFLN